MKMGSISSKLIIAVTASFLLLFFCFNAFIVWNIWGINQTSQQEQVLIAGENTAEEIREPFQRQLDMLEAEAQVMASHAAAGTLTSDFIVDYKRNSLQSQDDVFSNSVLFEPGIVEVTDTAHEQFVDATNRFAPYYVQETAGGELQQFIITEYEAADWYTKPVQDGQVYITPPYDYELAAGQMASLVTIVYPVFVEERAIGYVSADFSVAFMAELIAASTPATGRQLIATNDGQVVADSQAEFVGQNLAQILAQPTASGIYTQDGEEDMFQVRSDVVFEQMDTNWSMITLLPKKTILAPVYQVVNYTVIGAILMVALLTALLYRIIRKLLKPLQIVKAQLALAANGNLQAKVDPQLVASDEIGEVALAYNEMLEKIGAIVHDVQHVTSSLQQSAENTLQSMQQIAAGNSESVDAIQEIAKGAHYQSEEMDKTLHNMQTLSDTLSGLKEMSMQMNDQAKTSLAEMENGLTQMADLKEAQAKTSSSNVELSTQMHQLVDSMSRVTEIVATIDAISAQTNLLSLNASIEAARAGDHGKGFAVVAHEVKKLAEQTQQETKRIQETISQVLAASQSTLQIAEQTSQLIEQQSSSVQQAEKVFTNQSASSHTLEQQIATLLQNLDQIDGQKKDMLEEIQSVATISEQTAAAAEEVAANAVQQDDDLQSMKGEISGVNTLSVGLKSSVSVFK